MDFGALGDFSDVLRFIRNSPPLRWFLVVPLALTGGFLIHLSAVVSAWVIAPWMESDRFWWEGDMAIVFNAYTIVVLVAILAPSFKRAAATIAAVTVLSYLCWAYIRAAGPDENCMPYLFILGLGVCGAMTLVLIGCSVRELLVVPAFWAGAGVPAFFSMMITGILIVKFYPGLISQPGSSVILNVEAAFLAFGSMILPAKVVSSHRLRVALGCFLTDLALGTVAFFKWRAGGDLDNLILPGLVTGGFITIVVLTFRSVFKPVILPDEVRS